MRKHPAIFLFLCVFLLLGCQQDKTRMTSYLKELESSNQRMNTLFAQLLSEMGPIIKQVGKDSLDLPVAREKVQGIVAKLEAELKVLEGLQPPQEARALQTAVVNQQKTSLELVRQSLPMLEVASAKSDLLRQIKAKPAKGQEYMAQVRKLQAEQDAIKKKYDELTKEAAHFERQVRDEQKSLQQKFGIVIRVDNQAESEPTER